MAELLMIQFIPWNDYEVSFDLKLVFQNGGLILLLFSVFFVTFQYWRINKQLKAVIKFSESNGNYIEAWKELQKIKPTLLTSWQLEKYEKRRLYLRIFLGNLSAADNDLERYKDSDPVFYHYLRAIVANFRGKHQQEAVEIKKSENLCNGDTDPFLQIQIIANCGVTYVGNGEYKLANDCFERAIAYGKDHRIDAPDLWITIFYNYTFNKTRLDPDIPLNECLDVMEGVKQYIDIEAPEDYIRYSNVVLELMRQTNADRSMINEFVNNDIIYLADTNIPPKNRCVLEASTARMVCTGRLDPEIVVTRLSQDINDFLNLPMPERYRCFKEIDYMFTDLRGPIVEKNACVKETAHWYMMNQAVKDLEDYRATLPSEAVYEISYCFKERAGIMKRREDCYRWDKFLKEMQSAQGLYRQNELIGDAVICSLDIIDEATAPINLDTNLQSKYMDVAFQQIEQIEQVLPDLSEHPILNEVYLRLCIYCFALQDYAGSKKYYEAFRSLGEFSMNHFAPWLRGRYSVVSVYIYVMSYIETVEKIAVTDLSREILQVQDWFVHFHERNGYFEAVVLGRMLGADLIPLCVEMFVTEKTVTDSMVSVGDIQSAWLVLPALHVKIRCNGRITGNLIGDTGLFSDYTREINGELRFCDIKKIPVEVLSAIERIVLIIKKEMPDYLPSNEELNRIVEESWI